MPVSLLDRIQQLFSTRELASILWVILLLIATFFSKSLRDSYLNLLKAFFVKELMLLSVFVLLYIAFNVILIKKWITWNFDLSKELILWCLISLPFLVGKFSKIKNQPKLFKSILKETLTATLVLEILVSEFPFSFATEFFIMLPVITFITLLLVFLESEKSNYEDYVVMKRIFNLILLIVGFFLLKQIFIGLIKSYGSLPFLNWFITSMLPVYLTITIIPIIYLLSVYSRLENVLVPFKTFLKYNEPKSLLIYSWFKLGFRLSYLEGFKDELLRKNIRAEKEVKLELLRFMNNFRRHKINKNIPLSQGWGIHDSRFYLADFGLSTGLYKELEGDWFACSKYIEVGNGIIKNNISYYIDGDEFLVQSLRVVVSVINKDDYYTSLQAFSRISATLFKKAFLFEIPDSQKEKVFNLEPFSETVLDKEVEYQVNHWPGDKGFNANFTIRNPGKNFY